MSHLDQANYRALSTKNMPSDQLEFWEEHLENCETCQKLAEEWEQEIDGPGVEPPEAMRDTLLRAFIRLAPRRAMLKKSQNRLISELASTGAQEFDGDLLRLLGSTLSVRECAMKNASEFAHLDTACRELAEHVRTRHAKLLEEAEQAARGLCGNAFDEFVRRAPAAPSVAPAAAEVEQPQTPLERAAAGSSQRKQYPCWENPDYSLLVEEVKEGGKEVTVFRCLGPGVKKRWRFRLWLETAAEERILEGGNLTPERRGVLRVAHALLPARWTELLDVLIPWRHGSQADGAHPAIKAVIARGAVDGWLPGVPTNGQLWLLD